MIKCLMWMFDLLVVADNMDHYYDILFNLQENGNQCADNDEIYITKSLQLLMLKSINKF